MRSLLILSFTLSYLLSGVRAVDMRPPFVDTTFMGIKILDQKELSFEKIYGIKFAEISDVTYDKKTQTLYLLSDKGLLYNFHAHFSDRVDMLIPMRAVKLKNKKGKRFKKWKRDSEGLTLAGDGRLLISFEGHAKIAWFHKNSAKYGMLIKRYKLPAILRKHQNYRSQNKSLESVAWHKKYGILTAAEWPLKQDDKKRQTIYALSNKRWHFKAEAEGNSAVVAMEVMDDGNILVLERSYTGVFNPVVITLKKVYIKHCLKDLCPTKVLAKMNNHKGWELDNFEGVAKVGKHRYVMVSDDNENFFQRTLFIYFEVIDE